MGKILTKWYDFLRAKYDPIMENRTTWEIELTDPIQSLPRSGHNIDHNGDKERRLGNHLNYCKARA